MYSFQDGGGGGLEVVDIAQKGHSKKGDSSDRDGTNKSGDSGSAGHHHHHHKTRTSLTVQDAESGTANDSLSTATPILQTTPPSLPAIDTQQIIANLMDFNVYIIYYFFYENSCIFENLIN